MSETTTRPDAVTAQDLAGPDDAGDGDGGCGCGGCGCGGGAAAPDSQGLTLDRPVGADDLDLRGLPPERRHALVVAAVGALLPGEALVLANDHDPQRLRDLLESQHPGELGWAYLAEGPALWRVMISRESCC